MASERLTHVELESVILHDAKPRALSTFSTSSTFIQEEDVDTAYGMQRVIIQGDRSKPAIVTYHDIGLNSLSCFQAFFSYPDMQQILKHFCVYHVNAPGQQENACTLQSRMRHSESEKLLQQVVDASLTGQKRARSALHLFPRDDLLKVGTLVGIVHHTGITATAENYVYPSMDQLAEMLLQVLTRYGLNHVLGFGVGAGANVLARLALYHPEKVDGLVLINCSSTQAGWIEWGYQKWNTWYLKSGQMTMAVEDYLMWHWFGGKTANVSSDLLASHMDYLKAINPQNLGMFIDSYIRRSDLGIAREVDPAKKISTKMFRCPVMQIVGSTAAQMEDTVVMNSRLDPANSTWIKFECSGMVMEEVPDKLCESFLLFLQGLGYVPALRIRKMSMGSTESLNKLASNVATSQYQLNSRMEARC